MATLTIRIPDDKAERLKHMAALREISVNKLIDEWATMALAEFDTRASFMARKARGSAKRGLELIAAMNHREAESISASGGFHEKKQNPYKTSEEE